MITFKAPNGETLIALDEVQAAAFEKAGLEVVVVKEEKPSKTKKEQE